MRAGRDFSQMGQRDDEADGAVAAHAQVADVIEEDDTGGAGLIDRFAEQRAYDDIRSARLVDDGGTEAVVEALKAFQPLGEGAVAEVGAAGDDEARRLSGGVGVEDGDADWGLIGFHLRCLQL